jgi:phage baseplate assembly protein gpV
VTVNLYETIQRIVQDELRRLRGAELAVVQEQHPHASDSDKDNYACTVVLRDTQQVLARVPVATGRKGQASIPDVGDLVLVQFIGGDINAPIIIGSLYNDEDRPPPNDAGQVILHLPLGAAESDAVHFKLQSSEAREIELMLGSGLVVQLKDDDPVVQVEIDGGKASIQIDRDGAVAINTSAEMNLISKGALNIEGNEVNVEAQGALNLKGATVNIN